MTRIEPLLPQWPAPSRVRAYSTTRAGGVSQGSWAGLNLASHVQDDPAAVAANRQRLIEQLGLPQAPGWLKQVHGIQVCDRQQASPCEADAAYSERPGEVCVVLTADCLPVLFCDLAGSAVAAAHAGWRGLAAGVLEQTVTCFEDPTQVLAWMGPAIGPQAFEVGEEVRDTFVGRDAAAVEAFVAARPGHWLADLYQLARLRLQSVGVRQVYGGGWCTFSDPRFYSFRREPVTGRMASMIWLA